MRLFIVLFALLAVFSCRASATILTAKEAHALWPMMQVEDVVGAAFLPTDGQAWPGHSGISRAKGARTFVDDAQFVSSHREDVRALQADFVELEREIVSAFATIGKKINAEAAKERKA